MAPQQHVERPVTPVAQLCRGKSEDPLAIATLVQPARHHVTKHAAARQALAGHHQDAAGTTLCGARQELAQLELDTEVFGYTMGRVGDEARAGHGLGAASSIFKYYGTELNKRRNELNLAVGGESALGWEGEEYRDGVVCRDWLRSKGNSIEGGTSEVQLNIIAKRVLGLPDA